MRPYLVVHGGGHDDGGNLQLLCGHCNRVKGGRLTMPELRTRLKELGVVGAADDSSERSDG